jgi:hypothetical protein
MTLKMAVFAPMPRANVSSAMAVKIGVRPNRRNTWRNDLMENNTARDEFRFPGGIAFSANETFLQAILPRVR